MLTDKIKEATELRAKLAALDAEISAALPKELAKLPKQFGFDDAKEFVAALASASGQRRSGKASAGAAVKKKRTRAKITDEIRASVKQLVEAGKTGVEIAAAVGISLPSVQNIKKALGLVKSGKE